MTLHAELPSEPNNTLDLRERYRGALLGLAVGDAEHEGIDSPTGVMAGAMRGERM